FSTEAGVGHAASWLHDNARHSATAKKASACWDYAAVRLRELNPLPKADPKRAIVPCADAYIEIMPTGFAVIEPDPALGMVHAVNVACGGTPDKVYTPHQLPKESLFRKFIERALPDPAVRAVVQEQCGMTLLPNVYSQAAWWYGA